MNEVIGLNKSETKPRNWTCFIDSNDSELKWKIHTVLLRWLCFACAGSSVLDWLIKWHFATTRSEACILAKVLLRQAHFLPLPTRDDKNSDLALLHKEFCDSEEVFYRFVSRLFPFFLLIIAPFIARNSTLINNKTMSQKTSKNVCFRDRRVNTN